MKSKYVLLEGVDLSGKSSTIKHLKDLSPKLCIRHSSLLGSNELLGIAKAEHKDGSARVGSLYLRALRYDLENFVWPEVETIQDSTILLRSLGYHAAANLKNLLKDFERMLDSHPRFDQVFILSATMEERKKRLLKRLEENPNKVTRNDLLVIEDPTFFVRMEKALISYASGYFPSLTIIDTGEQSPSDIARQIGFACGII